MGEEGCGMSWRGREREVCQKTWVAELQRGRWAWIGREGKGEGGVRLGKQCWIDFFLLKSRVGVGIAGWVQNGYGCEGKSDGRDRGRGVGRGNSKNQGLLSVVVNISNEHDWDVYCLWKKLSLKPLKRSLDLFSPAYVELPPPDPEKYRRCLYFL